MGDPNPSDRARLKLTRWVLLVLMLGSCLVGSRWAAWPVVSWPMYARRDFPYPGLEAERVWLLVELAGTNGGPARSERVELNGLLPTGWDGAVQKIVAIAFADEPGPNAQQTLAHMVQIHFKDEQVIAIAAYREVWDVDPDAIPPLDRDHPRETHFLGRFELDERTNEQAGGAGS